ncbi:MAG: SigB/SigF/SigG family RNA polymerase sigma factor [Muricoprocola sp.]
MENTLDLIKRAHQGDKNAREQIIRDNMGLVYLTAKRFQGRGTEMEDLIQIGSIGLMKAIDHFDTDMEVKFSTYAIPVITGELKRFFRDDGMIKVGRKLKEHAYQIAKKSEALQERYGREPTIDEISQEIALDREEVVWALEACAQVESLQKPIFQGDGTQTNLEERIEQKEDANENLLNELLIQDLLSKLEPEEKKIIEMRYFHELTQTQIAELTDKTQVQISRLEKKILKKMKEWM